MRQREGNVGITAILLGAALVACGERDDRPQAEAEALGAAGAMAMAEEHACDGEIEPIAIGSHTTGPEGRYTAELLALAPGPPQKFRNDWRVRILDEDGEIAEDAVVVEAEPFMVAHQHDGLFAPEISRSDLPGEFNVDNLNLWMGGPWEVRLWIEGSAGAERLVFDVCIED